MAFENVRIQSTLNGVNPVVGTREDAAAGDTVQLSLTDTVGISSVRWDLVGRPEHSTAGGGPLPAVLATGLTAGFTIDPDIGAISLDGSYVVHAIINEGSPASRRVSVVIARASGLTIPAPGGGTSILRRLGAFESLEDTISIPTVVQGWATMLNRWLRWAVINIGGGGGGAEVVHPFYALDYDGGNDANVGFSDVSMADAGTKAKKTLEGLLAIIPADGKGATIDIGIKGRAAGATYLKQDGVTEAAFDLRPLQGYVIRVRATEDFSLSTEDQKRQSPVIAPGCAGPNVDSSFTITGVVGNHVTIGAGGLPTDATARGYRLRVYDPAVPGTTKYVRGIKRINGNDIYVDAFSISGVAINDVCVIERPGVAFTNVRWWGRVSGRRGDDGYGELDIEAAVLQLHGVRGTGAGGAVSEFVGGDVYLEFTELESSVITRTSLLEAFPYTAGLGARLEGAILGADFIDLTAVYLKSNGGTVDLFAEIIEMADSVIDRTVMVATGGEPNLSGSWLNRVRFTSPFIDTLSGGWFHLSTPERWEAGTFEFSGIGAIYTVSGFSGLGTGNVTFIGLECLHSMVDIASVTLPGGYARLLQTDCGDVLAQADFSLIADPRWGMRDNQGNMFNYSGAQVVERFQVGGAALSPYLAYRQGATANEPVAAIATSNANGRVIGVSMSYGDAGQSIGLVEKGITPLDMTDGLGLAYVPNSPVYLSDAVAGKGTVTAPGIAILIGYIVANSTTANRPYVNVNIKTKD